LTTVDESLLIVSGSWLTVDATMTVVEALPSNNNAPIDDWFCHGVNRRRLKDARQWNADDRR